ncbi:MAG: precorrin-3B C(17)-methyltransferase [bacterium]|nr:precorrin-3B C(17)-methyltransferase [bacterium]
MKLLYVIGIGPGKRSGMTLEAQSAIEQSGLIVGYHVYVDLIKDDYPDKEYYTTPMTQETERCKEALRRANEGTTVAMICSGDAGVYGMSGLILQLAEEYPEVEVEVIAGVTAAMSGAARLGAPLMHDFAVISLSDRLTPWEKIEKRLRLAAEGDYVIVLYNPSSKARSDYLMRACDILLEHASPETACGLVESIGRNGEQAQVLTLEALRNTSVNMFTTVFIGNSQTMISGDKLVTPRGYRL